MKTDQRTSRASPSDFTVEGELLADIALSAFEEMNSPRSLTCAILLRSGEFTQLAEMQFDPEHYNDLETAKQAWVATELLRKNRNLPGLDSRLREKAAREKAVAAERTCQLTNDRFREYMEGGGNLSPRLERAIKRAQVKIHYILGDYDLTSHLEQCRWGPGSDALNKRPFIGPYHKYGGKLSATAGAVAFLPVLLDRNHLWARWLTNPHPVEGVFTPLCNVLKGNAFLTVPKTALVDRPICIEPGANVYLQLGLGSVLRKRLRMRGVDLSSQERNRMLALEGSENSSWCTIDLSSASDMIARWLIQVLFSFSERTRTWLKVMESIRSKFTFYGKQEGWKLNHKFSSMGNGFTFELETLVFYALVKSVAEEEGGECAAVYGDDIIVSPNIFQSTLEVLEGCGFSVNKRKTYNSSYFRESCGMNAWNGYELTSYKLEKLESLSDVYSFHNGLVRCGLKRTARRLQRRIPTSLRFFGPSGAGDAVLWSEDYHSWKSKPHGLEDQWFFWSLKIRGLKWQPDKDQVVTYEPAILHSLTTLVALGDHTVYSGGRWGSEGLVTLSSGEWTVSELLVSREALGLPVSFDVN